MTVSVELAYLNDDGGDGEQYHRTRVYYTFNESNADTAATAAIATAPVTLSGIPLRNISRKQLTETTYEFTFDYSLAENQVQPSNPDAGEFNTVVAFNLIGGTTHITTALDTTSYSVSGRTLVDVHKTIGVDLKSGQVRGLDVFAPVADFSLTTQMPNAVVTPAYKKKIRELTARVNNATFYGDEAGSVIFKGARGTKKGADRWELQFEFAFSPNETGLSVGSGANVISGINKKGWEYLETMFTDSTDPDEKIGGKPLQVPIQVNVHEVFKSGNFADLRIGT